MKIYPKLKNGIKEHKTIKKTENYIKIMKTYKKS